MAVQWFIPTRVGKGTKYADYESFTVNDFVQTIISISTKNAFDL